jgi:sec-independent protein translocase protein TatB
MFGMGGTEIVVILIVALLFLGPDKLPQAAKSISKGIRDIKKQSRALQNQIESDEQIGGAIRDLKSALRGEDLPVRPKPYTPRPQPQLAEEAATATAAAAIGTGTSADAGDGDGATGATGGTGGTGASSDPAAGSIGGGSGATAAASGASADTAAPAAPTRQAGPGLTPGPAGLTPGPGLTLPRTAGEPDPIDGPASDGDDDLAALIKPAPGTVAKGS